MARELPIACTLSPAALRDRHDEMARVPLLSASVTGRHAELRFPPDARADVETIVAAEGECCAFLSMDLRDDGADLVLTVGAPAGAEPVLDGLIAAFRRTA